MSFSKSPPGIFAGILAAALLWLGTRYVSQWLAPRSPDTPTAQSGGEKTPPPAVADVQSHPKARHAHHDPVDPATLPPGTVWTFREDDTDQTYVIALDELYLPAGDAAGRLHVIPPKPDLAALLAEARRLADTAGVQPQLVLYPLDAPHDEQNRHIVTMRVHIEANDLAAVQSSARALGLEAWTTRPYAPGHAFAKVEGDPAQPLRAAALLAGLPHVTSAVPLLAVQRTKRAVTLPTDPLFPQQWHLRNTGQQNGTTGRDINVTPVWATLRGKGVTIGIVDDGLQVTHPDLAANVAATGNYDWNGMDTNPSPNLRYDLHGTAVAGLAAAAADNNRGGVGVAPEATLYGLRLIALPETDQDDGDAMDWLRDVIQIKNSSWGPADDTPWVLGTAGSAWQSAVAAGTSGNATTPAGRGGLGTIYVWAAGNGEQNGDQGGKDGYSSNIHVIPVGAVTNAGVAASFSEGGAHLVVCAPGDAPTGIYTTDLVGNKGYNNGITGGEPADPDYTGSFAGTSASSPIAAGAIALMLQANPSLGWRDVKEILLRSSTKLEPSGAGWVSRSGGQPSLPPIKHHPRYGGGLINTAAAVQLASTWTDLGKETVITRALSPKQVIPDKGDITKPPVDLTFDLSSGTILRVEHVEVTVTITHPYRGDLEIDLISPAGTVSQLATNTQDDDGKNYPKWTFTSVRHWGEVSTGTWTLSIRDKAKGYVGSIGAATLKVHGVVVHPPALNISSPTLEARIGAVLPTPLADASGDYIYSYAGLPTGIGYDTSTGALTGRAEVTGAFPVTLTATDSLGLVTSRSLTLVIDPLPAHLVGTFNGIVGRDVSLNQNLGGTLTFTNNTHGVLTGAITLGNAAPLPFSGRLDGGPGAHGTADIMIARPALDPVSLHLDLPLDASGATGTLGTFTLVSAWKKHWTAKVPATPYLGSYTFALETPAGHGWPAGYSVGTIYVKAPDTVTWNLQPADGTPARHGAATLAADGTFVFFAPQAIPEDSFLGVITLPDNDTSLHGDISWLRGKGTSLSQANTQLGFGPLTMTLHGGRYTAPAVGALLLDLPARPLNATLSFGGTDVALGSQAGELTPRTFTVTATNTIADLPPGATNLVLHVNAVTGRFSGTFVLTDANPTAPDTTVERKEKFSGVFLRQEGVGAGFFVLRSLPGAGNGTRSGTVLFIEAP